MVVLPWLANVPALQPSAGPGPPAPAVAHCGTRMASARRKESTTNDAMAVEMNRQSSGHRDSSAITQASYNLSEWTASVSFYKILLLSKFAPFFSPRLHSFHWQPFLFVPAYRVLFLALIGKLLHSTLRDPLPVTAILVGELKIYALHPD